MNNTTVHTLIKKVMKDTSVLGNMSNPYLNLSIYVSILVRLKVVNNVLAKKIRRDVMILLHNLSKPYDP